MDRNLNRITPDDKKKLIELYINGKGTPELAKIFPYKQNTIRSLMYRTRTLKNPIKYPLLEKDKDAAIKLYLDGTSPRDIAQKFSCNRDAVRTLVKRSRLARTHKEAMKLAGKMGKFKPRIIMSKENQEAIVKLYLEGFTSTDLIKVFPYKRDMILGLIKQKGVTRNKSEALSVTFKDGKRDKDKAILAKRAKIDNKGENSSRWIKDRTKLVNKRDSTKEAWFYKEVLKERDYTCELTGKRGSKHSVHHIKPVWSHPELQFSKENVIVIQLTIHKLFHKLYGTKTTESAWHEFLLEQNYGKIVINNTGVEI